MIDNELRQQYRQAVDDLRVAIKKTCLYRFCEEVVKKLSKILRQQGVNYMKKKILVTMLAVGMVATSLTGCAFETESSKVTYNMKQEAENFNILRRFAVINTRTDKVEFEMIGAFSREDATDDQVTLVVEMEDGTYKRHIIGLNEDTMYVIEDLGGAEVNKYKYEVNYIPESIVPFEITDKK